jgi:hypothetical protein
VTIAREPAPNMDVGFNVAISVNPLNVGWV